jgi:class 3 adenylate cyclase
MVTFDNSHKDKTFFGFLYFICQASLVIIFAIGKTETADSFLFPANQDVAGSSACVSARLFCEKNYEKKIFASASSSWWIVLSGLLLSTNIGFILQKRRKKPMSALRDTALPPFFHKIDEVSVLFADIEGFYEIADQLPPETLMKRLNNFFSHFDMLVDHYQIEKIKTIGDAYMCAGGVPQGNHTHPAKMVLVAMEMQQYLCRLRKQHPDTAWSIRIGIHTGEVFAGMLGKKKLMYDIWGRTVNLASRLESLCPSGKINISGATYERVKQFFVCEYQGQLPSELGDECSYHVKGLRAEYTMQRIKEVVDLNDQNSDVK